MHGKRIATLAGALLVFAYACGDAPATHSEPAVEAPEAAVRTYEIRGVVRGLPEADGPGRQIRILHEAVPDFETLGGKVTGMDSMTMPFELAPELELGEIAAGAKVRFELQVDWDRNPAVVVTRIEELPADTELTLAGG